MTNLETILKSTGLSVTYRLWPKKPPALPYIVYLVTGSDNFGADNIVYHAAADIDIELYSDQKDSASEALVEAALTENEIYYDKYETWIQSEELYQVVYSITWAGALFAPPPEPEEPEEPEDPDPEPEE